MVMLCSKIVVGSLLYKKNRLKYQSGCLHCGTVKF